MWQQTLLGGGEPTVDVLFRRVERVWLDEDAWVDRVPGWVDGSTTLFDELRRTVSWRQERREMYDRMVDVPRLTARFPDCGASPAIVEIMVAALTRRYRFEMNKVSASLYRDGDDSVAFHRDRGLDKQPEAIVGIVSLGGPRTFAVRPLGGGGRAWSVTFGWGDLLVMGGTANRDWEHGVPKCAYAEPRIALMFRHVLS